MGGSSDMIKNEIDDVFSPKRQLELEDVIRKLKAFKPNKIAVEAVKEADREINNTYHQYINNSLKLNKNEIQQIGFRLSAMMEIERIYPVDWMGDVGQRNYELYSSIMEEYIPKIVEPPTTGYTIGDMLIHLNQEKRVQQDHALYMQIARIGTGTDYIGVDWVRWWYQRNLTIFFNLSGLVSDSNDRIILLIRAVHIYLVRQFLLESGVFEVESTLHYFQ